jgi:hypothetical protein
VLVIELCDPSDRLHARQSNGLVSPYTVPRIR